MSIEPGNSATGTLTYRAEEYAFATEPRPATSGASFAVNEVELMLDDCQRVVVVEGYCPYPGWTKAVLHAPASRPGVLQAIGDRAIIPGVAVAVHSTEDRWPVLVDPAAGWVRLGKGNPEDDREGVEFAPAAIAVFKEARLRALWLRPAQLPPL